MKEWDKLELESLLDFLERKFSLRKRPRVKAFILYPHEWREFTEDYCKLTEAQTEEQEKLGIIEWMKIHFPEVKVEEKEETISIKNAQALKLGSHGIHLSLEKGKIREILFKKDFNNNFLIDGHRINPSLMIKELEYYKITPSEVSKRILELSTDHEHFLPILNKYNREYQLNVLTHEVIHTLEVKNGVQIFPRRFEAEPQKEEDKMTKELTLEFLKESSRKDCKVCKYYNSNSSFCRRLRKHTEPESSCRFFK